MSLLLYSHLPWVTIGVGETIVLLKNEVTEDERLAIKDEVLAGGSGLSILVSNIKKLV